MNGAEALVRLLEAHGVSKIFGLCGDTSLPFYDALRNLDHGIEHILTRDERSAAYMADAYARVTGKVGVCEGPSGGGATYLLPGLVEASESSIPVLGITSDVPLSSRGHYPLTELDQLSLFRPVTKFNAVLDQPANFAASVRAAFRNMTTGRPGAAHLSLPYDIQVAPVEPTTIWGQPEHGTYPAWPTGPDPVATNNAAKCLAQAQQPVVVCGGGVNIAGGERQLDQLARTLDLPVVSSISGRGCLGDDHPNYAGVIGSNGGVPATRKILAEADLVFFIGCRAGSVTTEKWRFPRQGTTVIHLDSDPLAISANYQVIAPLVADANLGLAALNEAIVATGIQASFGGARRCQAAREDKAAAFAKLACADSQPILPERLVAAINEIKDDNALLVVDAGTPCPYFSAYAHLPHAGRHLLTNRAHGALGYSLPAAIGAQFAAPNRQVIAVMGDGSFGFSLGELETATRHKLPIMFVVVANSSYGWIKAGQHSGFDKRYFSVDFNPSDHAGIAKSFGLQSFQVEKPGELLPALRAAADAGGPTLVDVACQPLELAQAPVSEWIA